MMRNPEFRRNLWIQFSSTRVLVAALITGLLLACALAADLALTTRRAFVPDITAYVARWLAIAILLLWAGRQAAGAVVGEIRRRTWDAQRLSTLHPWTMAWGKLLGATSLAWSMGLIAAAAYVAAGMFERPAGFIVAAVVSILGYGIVCQATGLLASLARLTGRPGERGGGTTIAHVVGLLATALLASFIEWGLETQGRWFGIDIGARVLRPLTIWFFALWAIVGVYRRMRRELQMRSAPWVWLLFLVAFVIYGEGLAYGTGRPAIALLLPAWLLAVMLWAMALIEAKDPLTLRQSLQAFGRGHWREGATLVPLWLITYIVFAVVTIVLIFSAAGTTGALRVLRIPNEPAADTLLVLVALLLFLTRDVLIVQVFTLGREANLAGLSGAVIWFVLYFAIPAVMVAGRLWEYLGLFLPTGQGGWMICLLPAAAEAIACIALFAWRWRVYWRENAAKTPVT